MVSLITHLPLKVLLKRFFFSVLTIFKLPFCGKKFPFTKCSVLFWKKNHWEVRVIGWKWAFASSTSLPKMLIKAGTCIPWLTQERLSLSSSFPGSLASRWIKSTASRAQIKSLIHNDNVKTESLTCTIIFKILVRNQWEIVVFHEDIFFLMLLGASLCLIYTFLWYHLFTQPCFLCFLSFCWALESTQNCLSVSR